MKAISKGSLAGRLVHMDVGSTDHLAQQSFQFSEHASKRTLPSWLFNARLSARDRPTSSRPDAIMVIPIPFFNLVNSHHLPLFTHNRCSTLDLMGN